MENYKFYTQIGPNVYKRRSMDMQYIIAALLLFSIGAGFFLKKAPQTEAYIFAGIILAFCLGLLSKISSRVIIDLNSQTIAQKAGILSSEKKISISDVLNFSISNRIYLLLLISSAFAAVVRTDKTAYLMLGQSFMNSKNMETLLLETESILGRR